VYNDFVNGGIMRLRNFDKFCEGKECEHVCVEYRNFGYGMSVARMVSCKLIGPTKHIEEYPIDCPYIDEIKEWEE